MIYAYTLHTLSKGKPINMKRCMGHPEEFAALVRAFVETGEAPDFITIDGGRREELVLHHQNFRIALDCL